MRRLTLFVASIIGLLASFFVARPADAVTFTFYETGITSGGVEPVGLPPSPSNPLALLELTFSDNSGSASWGGGTQLPSITDPSFAFAPPIAGFSAQNNLYPCLTGFSCPFYSISWSESAGQLASVSIDFQDPIGGIDVGSVGSSFGLTGGRIDYALPSIGDCASITCTVTGYWSDSGPVAVPEPNSVILVLSVLCPIILLRRNARDRLKRP